MINRHLKQGLATATITFIVVAFCLFSVFYFMQQTVNIEFLFVVSVILAVINAVIWFFNSKRLSNEKALDVSHDISSGVFQTPLSSAIQTASPDKIVQFATALETYANLLPQLTDLEREHLNEINKMSEKAAVDMLERLNKVEATLSDSINTVEQTKSELTKINDSGFTLIADAEQRIENLKAYNDEVKQRSSSHEKTSEEVVEALSNLSDMTDLVKSISSQTNLLSLNAAVEAARAGDYGRGFAVVADEVRALSLQSQEAAEKIDEGIGSAVERVKDAISVLIKDAAKEDEISTLRAFADDINGLAESFKETQQLSDDMCARLEIMNQDTKQMIVEGVTGMQFQDISKQRIEKVPEIHQLALESLVDVLQQMESSEEIQLTLNLDLMRDRVEETDSRVSGNQGKDLSKSRTKEEIEFF